MECPTTTGFAMLKDSITRQVSSANSGTEYPRSGLLDIPYPRLVIA
jgi:hypothetical protein